MYITDLKEMNSDFSWINIQTVTAQFLKYQ